MQKHAIRSAEASIDVTSPSPPNALPRVGVVVAVVLPDEAAATDDEEEEEEEELPRIESLTIYRKGAWLSDSECEDETTSDDRSPPAFRIDSIAFVNRVPREIAIIPVNQDDDEKKEARALDALVFSDSASCARFIKNMARSDSPREIPATTFIARMRDNVDPLGSKPLYQPVGFRSIVEGGEKTSSIVSDTTSASRSEDFPVVDRLLDAAEI
jgi:hypothetical protein